MSISRQASTRRRRRRQRPGCGFIYLLLTGLLIAGGLVYVSGQFFKVTKVEVVGAQRISEGQIVRAAEIKIGDNLLFLRKALIAEKLNRTFPYLKELRITRKFSGEVVLTVIERQAAVAIFQDDWIWLADESGRLLERLALPSEAEAVARVVGITLLEPEAGKEMILGVDEREKLDVLRNLISLQQEKSIFEKVAQIDMTRVFDVSFSLQEGERCYTVVLGTPDNLDAKLTLLLTVLEEIGSYESGTVDLSTDREARFRPE